MSSHPKHRASRATARLAWSVTGTVVVVATGAALAVVEAPASVEPGSSVLAQSAQSVQGTFPQAGKYVYEPSAQTVAEAADKVSEQAEEPLPDLTGMPLDELQVEAAKMQADFVDASLAYEAAETQADQAEDAAQVAEGVAKRAQADEAKAHEVFADQMVETYQSGVIANPMVKVLAGGSDSVEEFIDTYAAVEQVTTAQAMTAEDMRLISERSDAAAERAQALRVEATQAQETAQGLLADIQRRAARVAAAANEALAGSSDGQTAFASAEQAARNKAAARNWRRYLRTLDRAHVVPPAAAELGDPTDLPYDLSPLMGDREAPVPGVAAVTFKGRTVTVLPKETIAAVSRAFAAIGKPYVAGNAGPATYDCTGLTSSIWSGSGYRVAAGEPVDQYRTAHKVASRANVQVGDLVFFTVKGEGVQHVGVNLGGDLMLASDATASQVGVQPFPKRFLGAVRVTLPAADPNPAPESTPDSDRRCGGTVMPMNANGMIYPIHEGAFEFSSLFGETGPHWATFHTGLDLAAPTGTPVVAAKEGVVSVEASNWAGPNYVSIDHGDGLVTTYAHMSQVLVEPGAVVEAGELIGLVGALGNVTGPHLHFEVHVSDTQVDPMVFLAGDAAGAVGWGGFANGMIPSSQLCPLATAPGHQLRCDAAAAWNAMAVAYERDTGSPLCITDSYRSYAAQVSVYARKPGLAAVPGTSNHGWALAVDLCGGIESYSSAGFAWMSAHAPKFGWVHPQWARQGGGREEPWHWEFGDIS